MSMTRNLLALAIGALWIPAASAADAAPPTSDTSPPNAPNASGAMPGDESLTCEQIYAQGMAESQRDQQALKQRNDQLRAQNTMTGALVAGAVMTGGLGGTGFAAQAAAEASADMQMAMLATPPQTNARNERLRQLWTEKRCVKP